MSSNPQIPPVVQEQLARLQQTQQNFAIYYDAKTTVRIRKT